VERFRSAWQYIRLTLFDIGLASTPFRIFVVIVAFLLRNNQKEQHSMKSLFWASKVIDAVEKPA
jgi:hypothetical protein